MLKPIHSAWFVTLFIQICKISKLQRQSPCQPVMLLCKNKSVKSIWAHQETSEMISVDVAVEVVVISGFDGAATPAQVTER